MAILIGETVDFPSVMTLYSLTKREAVARVDRAVMQQERVQRTVRVYGTSSVVSGVDYQKAVRAQTDAKVAAAEAQLAHALVQDMDFRQQLTVLKQSWERFRMHVPGARDDQFLGNLMLGEGTEHGDALREAWQAICVSVHRVSNELSSRSPLLP
jgi:hypothetical protein